MPELHNAETITATSDELLNPQKQRADDAIAAIDKRLAKLHAETPEWVRLVTDTQILTGADTYDPKAFTAAIRNNIDRRPAVEEITALGELKIELNRGKRERRGGTTDATYEYLREQLDLLVEAVRDLGPAPATAEEAVGDPNSAAAYAEGQALVAAYRAIRGAQIAAWKSDSQWSPGEIPFFRETLFTDSIHHEQVWIDRRQKVANHRRTRARSLGFFFTNIGRARWPEIVRGPGPIPEGVNEVEYLRWVANECSPWIATPDEAKALHKEWQNAINGGIVPEPKYHSYGMLR